MNREIKFRGKNAGSPSGWVYGYFAIVEGHCCIFNEQGKHKVLACTEAQYTGLLDKQGKEIYEGDICRDKFGQVYEIKYSNGAYWFNWLVLPDAWSVGIEVIGNIYENPELSDE